MADIGWRRHNRESVLVYLSPFDCSIRDLPVPVTDDVLYVTVSPGLSVLTADSYQTMKLMEDRECGTIRCKRGMPVKAALMVFDEMWPAATKVLKQQETL